MRCKNTKVAKFKMISLVLVITMLLQILMPVIIPLKSVAVDNNGRIETSLGTIIIREAETTVEEGIIPIEIHIDGTSIFGITAMFDYDRELFEELKEEDIHDIANGWNIEGFEDFGEGIGYNISMSHSNTQNGYNDFTACIINLKLKSPLEGSTNMILTNVVLTDTNSNNTEGDEGTDEYGCYNITYNYQPTVSTSFSITYNKNTEDNVSNMPSNATDINAGTSYPIPTQEPTREGYTFTGWQTSDGTPYTAGTSYEINSNLDLYAQWRKVRKLTIDLNGGEYEDTSIPTEITNDNGETIIISETIPEPTNTPTYRIRYNANGGTSGREGDTQTTNFAGWTLSGGGTLSEDKSQYTFSDTPGTLTANYEGEPITLPNATKPGATFSGWYTELEGGTLVGQAEVEYTTNADITLFAHWNEIDYTLTINPNEGKYDNKEENTTITKKYNQTATIEDPEPPTGATITLYDGTELYDEINQEVTFSGWSTPTIGTFEGNVYKFGEGNDTIIANYTKGNITLPTDLTKTGHRFSGWYTTEDETGTEITTIDALTAKDMTLYAHWEKEKYTLTFSPGSGATPSFYTKEVTYGEPYGELPGATKDDGSTFSGWYIGETKITPDKIVEITEDKIVRGKWNETKYKLTVNPNGGKYNGATTETLIEGINREEITLLTPEAPLGSTITLDNNGDVTTMPQTKRFKEWTGASHGTINGSKYTYSTSDDSITATYELENVNLPTNLQRLGYEFKGWETDEGTKVDNAFKTETNITLHAIWEPAKYNITFEVVAEDATIAENEKTKEVIYGVAYGTLPTPTREGFDFDGWYDENDNKITSTTIVEITEDITLTAKWLGAEHTVTFDYGDGTTTSKTVRNEGTFGELPREKEKEGYTFVGWFDENDNKIESTTKVELEEDITVYAKYNPIKFTVVFRNDDGSTIDAIDVNYGANATYEGRTPEKKDLQKGYEAEFTGWDAPEKLQNIKSNVIVVATYTVTPITYTITYKNTKNDSNSQNPVSYTVEEENKTLINLVDQGKYKFKGWYTAEDETGIKVTTINTADAKDLILYAQWEEEKLWLSSDIYKIGENDIDNYEKGDKYIDKIKPGTTVAQFIHNCESNGDIIVINKDNQQLQDDDLIGTEMTVKVTKDDYDEISLIAVVMGDTDGNGEITPSDISEIKDIVLKVLKLEGARFKAADIDDTKKVTATDLSDVIKAQTGERELVYIKK